MTNIKYVKERILVGLIIAVFALIGTVLFSKKHAKVTKDDIQKATDNVKANHEVEMIKYKLMQDSHFYDMRILYTKLGLNKAQIEDSIHKLKQEDSIFWEKAGFGYKVRF